MLKLTAAGMTALFLTISTVAHSQDASMREGMMEHLSAGDLSALTDARLDLIEATLELTPEQQKLWPPVENAIRARAKNREARLEAMAKRVEEITSHSPIEALENRDPVEFLHRRAEALAQRAADLKNLADAWRPLYQSLTPQQKKRLGFLTVVVLREFRNAVEDRRMRGDEDEFDD